METISTPVVLSEDINLDAPIERTDVFENKVEAALDAVNAEKEILITLPQFLARFSLTIAETYYYLNNFKRDGVLSNREWEIITGL